MVIINLQKTPYDDECALRIFARSDQVMELLVKELGVEVSEYQQRELWKDKEWIQQLWSHYAFRSPSNDWFEDATAD